MQIASRDQTIAEMEKEKTALKEEADTLEQEKLILESELDTMRNAIAAGVEKAEAQAAEEEGPQADTTFPSL